jgi:pimeloyl-ACP methyl ester carboxylesterase
MAVGLMVGWVCGVVLRSRWAMLLAPIAFMIVFELVRMGTAGPTVDAPAASTYGIFAMVVGRGFHGLVALTPMVLGAALGAGFARRWAATVADQPIAGTAGLYVRRGVAVLTALVLVVLAAFAARPATTDPIVDASGAQVPGSIAELTTVNAGGKELGLMIRGASMDNPVVLFLAGGPGGSERGAMRNHLEALEETFTVATWDQRGTGTSYPALDPTETLTLDGQVADTIEVTDYLRDRFGQKKIYLLGQSWGSTLGVLAVQEAPDRYAAFIGTGQMVSQLETDRIFYDDSLAWAEDEGNDALADKLRGIGPPPYSEMLDYETALSYEHEVYPYDHTPNSEGEAGYSENFFVPEYTLTDQIHLLGTFMDTFATLYPQLQEIDFRRTATEFEVPMFFVQGAHEAGGRSVLFDEWYPMIEAPEKDLTVLETSGHRPLFEQPDEFVDYVVDTVLAANTGGMP